MAVLFCLLFICSKRLKSRIDENMRKEKAKLQAREGKIVAE
jgi:hypothetical protein